MHAYKDYNVLLHLNGRVRRTSDTSVTVVNIFSSIVPAENNVLRTKALHQYLNPVIIFVKIIR